MRNDFITTPNTNTKLHYRLWESPGPPMVLVHGLASTLRIWDFVAPILAEKFTVVAYDQRGHAESDKPSTGYDLPTEVQDLNGLISALDLQKPVIVGHSWGATIALGYAVQSPGDCSGVALVDGGVSSFRSRPGATWESVSQELAPPDLSKYTIDDLVSYSCQGPLSSLPESFFREFYGSMMDVQPDGRVRARLLRDRHLAILRAIWDNDPRDLLPRITVPLLAVLARQAPKDPGQEAFMDAARQGVEYIESLQGKKKVVWLDDTIHDIPLHRPERLARELIDFFAS